VQRYWFGWPTAMLVMAFVESVCGVKIGRQIHVEPLVPQGWQEFSSPRLLVRGHELEVKVEAGTTTTYVDGTGVPPGAMLG